MCEKRIRIDTVGNSNEVISWFNNIQEKKSFSFIQFDIVNFYPSISEKLLTDAVNWARNFIDISDEEENIIFKSKMSILHFKDEEWIKKRNSTFDITMGSFDGAESCDICGLFLLSKLKHMSITVGLYRDDGLAISKLTPRQTENAKKAICAVFKKYDLSITIEANLKVVNFLDVQLDLEKEIYKPFMKPNDKPNYVHSQSNHPPGILRNIPKSINTRLNNISANKDIFDQAVVPYQEDLNKKGYKYKLEYEPPNQNSEKKKKRAPRNITYFNPPYSKNVKTNVGAKFLRIIHRNFPKNHPLHKIINKNTIKISYRCMPNLKQHINKHNSQILNSRDENQNQVGCNCLASRKEDCPIPGRCTTENVVYRAVVRRHDTSTDDCYTGLTGDRFKDRFNKHQSDIRLGKNTASKLSHHVCKLKEQNIPHDISWNIIARAPSFNPTTKVCRLCLTEAYHIMFTSGGANLNKRDELFGFCKHKWKKLLWKRKKGS